MSRIANVAVALLVTALPLAAASAQSSKSATAAAATTIRTGVYDLELATGGGTLQGALELRAIGDSLAAKVHVGDHEAPPVNSLTRTGSHVVMRLGGEGMKVVYDLTFDGDAVSGTFTFNGDPGLVTGKRRKAPSSN